MNMLLDRVPDHLVISGTRYPINTSYRTWIKYEQLLTDNDTVLIEDIFKLIFADRIPAPDDFDEAVDQIIWFYNCGKDPLNQTGTTHKEVFSYDYDDGYIASAFKKDYDIDLDSIDLHWWKFRAYMLSLSEDNEFVKIMGYRAVEINSKMPAAQRSFYQKMKKIYKLPVKKKEQELNNRLEEALLNGESIDGLL